MKGIISCLLIVVAGIFSALSSDTQNRFAQERPDRPLVSPTHGRLAKAGKIEKSQQTFKTVDRNDWVLLIKR
ncbi:MAG: hypothetical protein U9Q07_07770 [Planctomycetota bacterium]|nr:hypothetical protein [Planctomycetota bacterium]